jgi:glycosyltransferase involved in cell wall biosynthesis
MQSFSVGTPVIASDLGGRTETVSPGECGLVFKSGVAGALEQLVRYAAANPDACRHMGAGARRRYEERFSLDAGRTRLLEIYQRVLTSTAAGER